MRDFFKNPAAYLPTSGYGLDLAKIVAAVFMVVDHLTHIGVIAEEWSIYLGRSVLPLFAYTMACHFLKGRIHIYKYSFRLLLFGVLAQPAYWLLLVNHEGLRLNIMFTLLFGMLVFYILDFIGGFRKHILIIFFLLISKPQIGVSYDVAGIILPTLFYLFLRGNPMGFVYLVIGLFLLNTPYQNVLSDEWWNFSIMCFVFALIGMGMSFYFIQQLVSQDNENKRILPRWFLYWFYPVHLVVIIMLGLWLEQIGAA